jgi:hypothetical protein
MSTSFGGFHRGDLADQFQPVHDRQVEIAQDEVDSMLSKAASASAPFRGFHNLFQFDARLTQRRFDYFAHHRGVIHDERSYLNPWASPLCGLRGQAANRLPPFSTDVVYIGSSTRRFRKATTGGQPPPATGRGGVGI